ncbi:carbon-nitrogen hydrolase [Siminovitchia terrae]|uniref:Carbon-nitrogen hydrolase n=1 Tax=Siminovitchia terrae TaxID=1914933 RepID=A0ABQ4KX30_SIMTE|nr:carbon-nitrogen hydrolase family protein [Siminovitchia terrae]GIN96603.1 carbon-nitrogen hydrolase [Siminovitchia terrae]
MKKINLALAQLRSSFLNKKENVKRIKETIELASTNKADYILFPELFTTGYLSNNEIREHAETINSTSIEEIRTAAHKNNCGVIFGFAEELHGKIFNTALFINKEGKVAGSYRKIHLFEFEKNIFMPGNTCPVFDTPEGKIGLMITQDIEYPEVSRILAINGAQLILVLCANMYPYQRSHNVYLHGRAMENHVFVASSNKVGLEGNNVFLGESIVIDPKGKPIYKSGNNEEVPIIEINFEEIEKAKGALNYLNNRRPDIYLQEGMNPIEYRKISKIGS